MPDSQVPLDLRARIAAGFAAYKTDTLQLLERDLTGFTHIMASRMGLYAVNETEWRLLAHGFFFGITFRGEDIYVFEACDQPHSSLRQGRILRLERRADKLTGVTLVAKGLDNGCHQIDFIGEDLYIVDTYNQLILRLAPGALQPEVLTPLPPCEGEKRYPRYVHVNSILGIGDKILLMLHNGATHSNRNSEIGVFDRTGYQTEDRPWRRLSDLPLDGLGCHGFSVLEDGRLLTCGSMGGDIISPDGFKIHVCEYMTRGLAVGKDGIAVGASTREKRDERMRARGTVTFLDRDYNVRNVLQVPGAPTELRRLDGEDYGLSNVVARLGMNVSLDLEFVSV